MNQLIAFDIETAKDVPGDEFDWRSHRPLGISCISSYRSDEGEPQVWFTRANNDAPAKQMSQNDAARFIEYLTDLQQQGFTVVTWNGLSFDFDILAEESAMHSGCEQLARRHVDMMFHIVCEKGFPVSLSAAAVGQGLTGKKQGVQGIEVPRLWASGEYEKVREYVKQDARITLKIALKATENRTFRWKTRKGSISSLSLHKGWRTVEEAMQFLLPDTSWMSNPPRRKDYYGWLQK